MPSILVIDDDEQLRKVLRQSLEREGYEVLDAPDGNKGMKLYREHGADLIITDLIMPDKEGLETINEARRNFPQVKIIAISGGGSGSAAEYLHLAKKFGADITLQKPFERKEFLDAIEHLLT
jgi:DNA-binding response OmpR family regulator